MSNLQTVVKLCAMLGTAQEIIKAQAQLLAMHGIITEDGQLEKTRGRLLAEIEDSV